MTRITDENKDTYSRKKTDDIMQQLEEGIRNLFESETYKNYLKVMSKFHNYSFNNSLLISLQKPDATCVAGYYDWQRKFNRQVKRGEKGIDIIAPSPYKKKAERDALDPVTQMPIKGPDGETLKEMVEMIVPAYRVVTVFDISQTEGEPLPSIGVDELQGDVKGYRELIQALEAISSVPISRETIEGHAKGYFSPSQQRITLQVGLSEVQEIKTLIHEIGHSILHNTPALQMSKEEEKAIAKLDKTVSTNFGVIPVSDYLMILAVEAGYDNYVEMRKDGIVVEGYEDITPEIIDLYSKKITAEANHGTKEVQAESVAYVVCQHFGIETSEYSFGYIAGWSSDKNMKELKESMNTIRKTANQLITQIEEQLLIMRMKKEVIVKPKQEKETGELHVAKKHVRHR